MVGISQYFVAFSKYMNFKKLWITDWKQIVLTFIQLDVPSSLVYFVHICISSRINNLWIAPFSWSTEWVNSNFKASLWSGVLIYHITSASAVAARDYCYPRYLINVIGHGKYRWWNGICWANLARSSAGIKTAPKNLCSRAIFVVFFKF